MYTLSMRHWLEFVNLLFLEVITMVSQEKGSTREGGPPGVGVFDGSEVPKHRWRQ